MTRPAYLSIITNAAYAWSAWQVWAVAPTVSVSLYALAACSSWFHITGTDRARTADVMAMWAVVGSLIGLCVHPLVSAALASATPLYYVLMIGDHKWHLWTGQRMIPAILLLIVCALGRWAWEGAPAGFLLPLLVSVTLMAAAYGSRWLSEKAYGSADGPVLIGEKDVAHRVPTGWLGWGADLGHGCAWHTISSHALVRVTIALCSLMY